MAICFGSWVGPLQAIAYFTSTLISFFVVIPIGTLLRDFQGSCILYAEIVWDGKTIFPYSEPSCDFVLYFNVACTLLYSFLMGIYATCAAVPRRFPFASKHYQMLKDLEVHDENFKLRGTNPVFLVINGILAAAVLSNAIIVAVGFRRTCAWMVEDAVDKYGEELESCNAAKDLPWDEFRIIRGADHIGVRGQNMYPKLMMASVASLLLVLVWLFQLILSFSQLKCFDYCSCDVAEEKQKPDKAYVIASRRSRLATPIGTPGHRTPGHMTPGDMTPGRMTPGGRIETGPMRPYNFGQQQPGRPGGQQPFIHRPQQGQVPRY